MKAIIWSKNNCVQCEQAKAILINNGIDFEERKIGTSWTKEDLLSIVPNARSVPQIFIDNFYVGGLVELKSQLKTQSL